MLFPPHEAPPGVFPSADGASVEAPVSVMEWFATFYAAAHARIAQGGGAGDIVPAILTEGNILS